MKGEDRIPVAIIGSGNIGTDLMIKVMRTSKHLVMGAMVGIDPASDGLARAKRLGVPATHEGVEGLVKLPNFKDIRIAFDFYYHSVNYMYFEWVMSCIAFAAAGAYPAILAFGFRITHHDLPSCFEQLCYRKSIR